MAGPSRENLAYQLANKDDDLGPRVIAISVTLIVATVVATTLRLFARFVRKVRFGWDDWLSAAAMVFVVGLCANNVIAVQFGLGKRGVAIDPQKGYYILMMLFLLGINYGVAHWFIKMAILLTIARLFPVDIKWFKYSVHVMVIYVSVWAVSQTIVLLMACHPISYFWERFDIFRVPRAEGICNPNLKEAELVVTILNSVADFILLVLPIAMLLQTNLKSAKKIGVIMNFLVGLFACVASILRITSTRKELAGADPSWDMVGVFTWTAVEAAVGLICACIPPIRPLFRRRKPRPPKKLAEPTASETFGESSRRRTIGSEFTFTNTEFTYNNTKGSFSIPQVLDSP